MGNSQPKYYLLGPVGAIAGWLVMNLTGIADGKSFLMRTIIAAGVGVALGFLAVGVILAVRLLRRARNI